MNAREREALLPFVLAWRRAVKDYLFANDDLPVKSEVMWREAERAARALWEQMGMPEPEANLDGGSR